MDQNDNKPYIDIDELLNKHSDGNWQKTASEFDKVKKKVNKKKCEKLLKKQYEKWLDENSPYNDRYSKTTTVITNTLGVIAGFIAFYIAEFLLYHFFNFLYKIPLLYFLAWSPIADEPLLSIVAINLGAVAAGVGCSLLIAKSNCSIKPAPAIYLSLLIVIQLLNILLLLASNYFSWNDLFIIVVCIVDLFIYFNDEQFRN